MNKKQSDTLFTGDNLPFIEELYRIYREDPNAIDASWHPLFEEYFENESRTNGRIKPTFVSRSIFSAPPLGEISQHSEAEVIEAGTTLVVRTPGRSTKFAASVKALVRAYRLHGHLIADIDPLGRERRNRPPELDPSYYGIEDRDMDAKVRCESLFGNEEVTLSRVIERLHELYCDHIGIEFLNIPNTEERHWLRKQIEVNEYAAIDGAQEKKAILEGLLKADAFEEFLDKKYVGAKRFSVTGGDALIPMMMAMLDEGGRLGVRDAVIGMAHRGRLNVLHNIMGKPAYDMLAEFEKAPNPEDYLGSSDVKYHMGYSNDYKTRHGDTVHLSLTFNPSHLEFVNPVVMGRARAKQDRQGGTKKERQALLPVLLHGDAAFSGQGIVAESLNLARLEGHDVGGTMHIVINNQIGFTALPEECRSTTYATDIAKILEVPIFHVNADNPEAAVRAMKLAIRYRQRFQQDVVIDLVCYRRYGHNEGDEPRFTQPLMYQRIDANKPVREKYMEQLDAEGVITLEESSKLFEDLLDEYAQVFQEVQESPKRAAISSLAGVWHDYRGGDVALVNEIKTTLPRERLTELGMALGTLPDELDVHRTIRRLHKQRQEMASGERPLDWGMAEALAFASLISEGTRIRLCGQDSVRGTFGHRHAAVANATDGSCYWPIRNMKDASAPFEVFNSMLSEAGVMGFEYGFSLDYPDALVLWEAQFGDFVNGAQVILDQFITSGEDKWKRLSGLVLLLPHGFEGQGPEHSSARLERFLQSCAEDNIFVCNLTTPAQYFHVLRRQVKNRVRKPLIIMTPKSLLRHKEATSTLEDLSDGGFEHIKPEVRDIDAKGVKRVILCTGKVYYDLLDHARQHNEDSTAILRIEQLYPLANDKLKELMDAYPKDAEIFWVQEEPRNMGAWSYIFERLIQLFGTSRLPHYVGRVESASPATGSHESHELEQAQLLREAFDPLK